MKDGTSQRDLKRMFDKGLRGSNVRGTRLLSRWTLNLGANKRRESHVKCKDISWYLLVYCICVNKI